MKLEALKALAEKHTVDGAVNYEGLNRDINADFDTVIERKEETARNSVDVSGHKAAGAADLLKRYSFDNEGAFAAFVANAKQGETDLSKKATRLEGENETLKEKVATLEGSVGTLTSSKTLLERLHYAVTNKEVNVNPEFAEFVVDKVSKSLGEGDDFKESLRAYIEANPQYGTSEERRSIGAQTGGSRTVVNPWAKETRDLAEQTRIYRENPAKARQLAKEAGVKI